MKRHYYLVLFILFCGHLVKSQKNFQPAVVITSKKDTIQGYIDYQKWSKNPEYIEFKYVKNEKSYLFKPSEITSFSVGNEFYTSAFIKVETSPRIMSSLDYGPELNTFTDSVYLQTLVKGNKSLYSHKNNYGTTNFYIKIENEYHLLEYKKYIRRIDYVEDIEENKKFIGQIKIYFDDCKEIQLKEINPVYSESGLMNLFANYYHCVHSNPEYKKKRNNLVVENSLILGTSLSSIFFESQYSGYLVETNYSNSINMAVGLSVNFIFPRGLSKWSFYNDLLVASYNVNGTYEETTSTNQFSKYYTEFEYSYLKFYNLIRYTTPISNWHLFTNVGLSNGIIILGHNELIKETLFYSTSNTKTGLAVDETRKHEQAAIAGIGLNYNKISLEARTEFGNGILNFANTNSYSLRLFILFSFQFH